MRQKRSHADLTAKPDIFHIRTHFLEQLVKDQDSGTAWFGQALYPAAKRTRQCQALSWRPFVDCYQEPVQAPPEPVVDQRKLSYLSSSFRSQVDNDYDSKRANSPSLPFTREENNLLYEARALGKSFADIARMLPHRTVTVLKKHYSASFKPKVPPAKKPPPAVSTSVGVSPVAALTAALHAKVLSSSTPPPALEAAPSEVVEVDHRCTNRAGGDARLQMLKPLPGPPKGFTGVRAHQLKCTDGIKFFQQVRVVDPDDETKVYHFDLEDSEHCACFNIGQSDTLGDDGQPNPIISWSDLHVLYQLPDGTKWAEHGNFFDSEDVNKLAKALRKDPQQIIPKETTDRELFKKAGRSHSRLQNIEFECWVFKNKLPLEPKLTEMGIEADNAYYVRIAFNPKTLEPST